MTQPKIISEEPLNIYEVKKYLDDIETREGELSFRSKKTKEYIVDASQVDFKTADKFKKEIVALEIPRFKDEYIAKIIDVKPVSVDDLKQLISVFGVTVKDDYLKKIIEVLSKK